MLAIWWELAISVASLCSVCGIQTADFQSDWFLMEAQTSQSAIKKVAHGLGEVPLKVKVLVKPTGGPYEGWMFEASSSQQADDDLTWLYCGIIYTYNVSHVLVFAPNANDDYRSGKAFCIDPSSWTSSNGSDASQTEDSALVKIFAWRPSSFPPPDLDTDWHDIAAEVAPNFAEVAHDLGDEPSLALLQIRCNPTTYGDLIYADGIGAGSNALLTSSYHVATCGLVFAYNSTHVRVWSVNEGSAKVACARDGYGENSNYRCAEGQFRLRGWKSLGQEPQVFSLKSTSAIRDLSALKVNVRDWDPLTTYISVQVKALDGPNAGFIFHGIGQAHRNRFPDSTYGGVVFAYSATSIRLFVPADETGTIVHIPSNWGTTGFNQMSNNVEITVKMWSTTPVDLCSNKTVHTGIFSRFGRVNCSPKRSRTCVSSCLSDSNCVGVILCSESGQCAPMDLDGVNRRLSEGVLGAEGEAVLVRFNCS